MVGPTPDILELLLPDAPPPVQDRARRITTFLRLLATDARSTSMVARGDEVVRASEELERETRARTAAAIVALLAHHLGAGLTADTFTWFGEPALRYQDAWDRLAGLRERLPRLAAGEVIGTFAFAEGHGRPSPSSLTSSVSDGKLTGTKLPVADGDAAGIAVVVANNGLYLVELDQDGVTRRDVPTLDPSRGHSRIEFAGAKAEALGDPGEGWALTQKILDRAAVLFAWEQVGGSEASLEMAKEYALGRYAFGRPIASYQAIKHKLANMYVKNTLAKSNCYYGAWALNTGAPELGLAAATARVSATQAYYFASKENIQTHGGMGFTWEFDCQLYYRRAKLLSVNIGSEGFWQDRLITAVEQSNAA